MSEPTEMLPPGMTLEDAQDALRRYYAESVYPPPDAPMLGEEDDLSRHEQDLADEEEAEIERAHYLMRHGHF